MKKRLIYSFFFCLTCFLITYSSTFAAFGIKPTLKEERKDFRTTTTGEKQEFRASVSAEIQAKRDAFQTKLQTIRDEKKKMLLTKINTMINEINRNRMETYARHLAKMTELLNKISERAQEENTKGKNVAALDGAISAAQSAISTASVAVSTQKEKEYVLTIQSETTLRATVSQTILGFKNDLELVRTKVTLAKKAVAEAFNALAKVRGEGEKTASPSGTINR